MDNLKTLFDKNEFELVIKSCVGSVDPKERLLVIASLMRLNKVDEALDEIEKYQSLIVKTHQLALMKVHFELLFYKRLFDEAELALSYYESLPYVSQEVEEFMRDTKETINELEHPSAKPTLSIDEICDVLEKETDQEKYGYVLFSLKDYNLSRYVDSLVTFINRSDVHPNMRTYGLIILKDEKYETKVSFLSSKGETIEVIPSKLMAPYFTDNFNNVLKFIDEYSERNITLKDTATHLFNCYILDTYPEDIYKDDILELSKAFINLAKKFLAMPTLEVSELEEKVAKIIESTPPLTK